MGELESIKKKGNALLFLAHRRTYIRRTCVRIMIYAHLFI
nr:MAG TPA: hypothetical protein [Caudoviricetes sp.]